MEDKNLKESIILIGPTCVGKSLVAGELQKKLDLPILSIDDLIHFIDMEQRGILSPSQKAKEAYLKECIKEVESDKSIPGKHLKAMEIKLLTDYVDLYSYYCNMVGPLKKFYSIADDYTTSVRSATNSIESIYCYKDYAFKLLEASLQRINQPIIIDQPAPIGFKAKKISLLSKIKLNALSQNISPEILDSRIENFLRGATTILLEPGLDYNLRNANPSRENDLLIDGIGSFYDSADLVISTNGLFNEPENKWFQQRTFSCAEEISTKERLKNQSEINNISDTIIEIWKHKLSNNLDEKDFT